MPSVREVLEFMFANKTYWLAPVCAQTALFGVFVLLSQGASIAPLPFIYALF